MMNTAETARKLYGTQRFTAHELAIHLSEMGYRNCRGDELTVRTIKTYLYSDTSARWDALRKEQVRRARERGTHTVAEWDALKAFYGNSCVSCGRVGSLTKDHVIPMSDPLCSDGIDNLQPLCKPCNSGIIGYDFRPEETRDDAIRIARKAGLASGKARAKKRGNK